MSHLPSAVAAVITDPSGRVLLCQQSHGHRLWGLPGGPIRHHESPVRAAVRDIREETGGIRANNMVMMLRGVARVTGSGTVDSKDNLNFAMKAVVDISKSAVGRISTVLGNKNTSVPVPFHIKGTTKDPKFIPDVGMPVAALPGAAGILGNKAGSATKGLTGGLGGLVGKF